ncbi:PadR family transcriptional regulator [Halorubrum coriense DSM 10284]|uniref:PadR family transcriptional regulator n=1 Tax=Halorubrum coriense DSM 10284 TaxID=1227466 RepID=M0EMK1_9EURY|nr:helix-turn-helix transcriptional regulator [Halorubrum coriense]ELZ48955.1 PadR family transcriptional regulator [Halorubrum coriense DSM 10284]QRG24155.1 PadR-family transcriptional regulator protein [Halorubrum virus Humcor1]
MSKSNSGPIQDGPNDAARIDADHETREQLRAFADLTAFKRDILWTLFHEADHEAYGLRIKRQLEALYGDEVNHGRLYPNLDDLVEAGLVVKTMRDKRTNDYTLSDEATQLLAERQAWERGEY